MPRRSPPTGRTRAARAAIGLLVLGWTGSAPGLAAAAAAVGGDRLADAGVVVALGPGSTPPPENEAHAYVVADLDSGDVLAAKSAHDQLPPASTLKVLTALALLPDLDKAQVVLGTEEDMLVEGSKVGIEAGLSYSVDLLFTAMLVDSGNDAAHALARTAGGVEQTVRAMNALAGELQAFDTRAVNPSGLDAPGQVTSAYDLALLARAALDRTDFRDYVQRPTADLPTRDGATYQIQNGNRLLGAYEGLVGGKNGWTTLARHTYVAAAERDGRAYLVSVMKTEGRAEPVAAALLDWAFANAGAVDPVGTLVPPQPPPVAAPSTPPAAGSASPLPGPVAPAAGGPAQSSGGGLGASTTVGIVGVGLLGAVAALRVRAVRRARSRRRRHAARAVSRGPTRRPSAG